MTQPTPRLLAYDELLPVVLDLQRQQRDAKRPLPKCPDCCARTEHVEAHGYIEQLLAFHPCGHRFTFRLDHADRVVKHATDILDHEERPAASMPLSEALRKVESSGPRPPAPAQCTATATDFFGQVRCNQPAGHRNVHLSPTTGATIVWQNDSDTDNNPTEAADGEQVCGAEPPDDGPWGDCWCTRPPGHDGEHRCQPCTERHGAPGWNDETDGTDATETSPAACAEHDGRCFPDPDAQCSAHGDRKCAHCHRNPAACLNDRGDCSMWASTGMHWDTCPNRVRGPLAAPAPDVDPELVARNAGKSVVDDPPICVRRGCGHLVGRHEYDRPADTHGACKTGCGCASALWTAAGIPDATVQGADASLVRRFGDDYECIDPDHQLRGSCMYQLPTEGGCYHIAEAKDAELARLRAALAQVRRFNELTADSCRVQAAEHARDNLRIIDRALDDTTPEADR